MEKLHLARPAYTRLDVVRFEMSAIQDLIQSPDDLKDALMQLQNRSLIKPRQKAGPSSMWMHRLIRTIVLEDTRKSGGETGCFETARALTPKAFEHIGNPTSPEECPRYETLIPHIQSLIVRDGVSEEGATNDILLASGGVVQYMASQEQFEDAQKLSQPLLSRSNRLFGSDHVSALISIVNQPYIYVSQSLYSGAERLLQQALDITGKWSQLRLITILGFHTLVMIYSLQGRYKEAERLAKYVLQHVKYRLGPEHIDMLKATRCLAHVYQLQRRYSDAEHLFLQVIQTGERHLGSEHTITLSVKQELGLVYQLQRRYNDAEELFDQVLGSVHDDTLLLTTMHNMALVYHSQGRYSDAERLFKQVLERRKQDLGREHADTLSIVDSLVLVYQSQGRNEEAEQLLREVRQKRFGGRQHVDKLRTMHINSQAWHYIFHYGAELPFLKTYAPPLLAVAFCYVLLKYFFLEWFRFSHPLG